MKKDGGRAPVAEKRATMLPHGAPFVFCERAILHLRSPSGTSVLRVENRQIQTLLASQLCSKKKFT